jgi:hypothetical protein
MKRFGMIALVVATACVGAASFAAGPDGRGTGMAGAFQTLADGADGLWWNPAVLGTPLLGSVVVGTGLQAGNNALSLTRLAGIAQNKGSEKRAAVKDIADKGHWDGRIEMLGDPRHGLPAVGVTVWRVGIGFYPHALVSALNVSPDAAGLVLSGAPQLAAGNYTITGVYSRAEYAEAVAGYAHDLGHLIPGVSLRAGAALKYLMGTNYEFYDVNQKLSTGSALLLASASQFKGTKGSGAAADLGIQASFFVFKLGLAVKNIGASLKWTGTETDTAFDSGTKTYKPPVIDTAAKRTQTLPTELAGAVSAGIPLLGTKVAIGGDLAGKTKEQAAVNRLRIGAEQPLGLLQIQVGYATPSASMPAEVSAGLGVGLSLGIVAAHVNVGGALATNLKGGAMALSVGASF